MSWHTASSLSQSPARCGRPRPADMRLPVRHTMAHSCRCSRRPWQEVAEVNSGKSIQEQLSADAQESVANLVDVDRTGELLLWIWSSIFGKRDEHQVTQTTNQVDMQISKDTQQSSIATKQPSKQASNSTTGTVILGGDCFWCLDAAFRRVNGVVGVVCGYIGGSTPSPTYDQVSAGSTGHAEVVCVEYNASIINLCQVLQVWLAVIGHSSEDKQKTQYRPIICCTSTEQYEEARTVIESNSLLTAQPEIICLQPTLIANDVTDGPQTQRCVEGREFVFWPAEPEHQDMFSNQPTSQYSLNVIRPKLAMLDSLFHEQIHVSNVCS